jgi:hypothetical protein
MESHDGTSSRIPPNIMFTVRCIIGVGGRHHLKSEIWVGSEVEKYLPPSCHLYQKQMDFVQSSL